MDLDSQILSNPEIKSTLLTIYDKIGMPPTREVGYQLFLDLILNNLYSSDTITFIISQVGDFINSLNPKEKDPYLKLLSLIFFNPNNHQDEEENNGNPQINKNIYYIYLSPVLNIIQLIIKEQNSNLFISISNIYAEIVQNVMPTDISASTRKLNMEEKKAFEILQGFCIYNMKYDDKSNRIVGSLCLTKLVENCPIVLQSQYTKFIWDNINNFIDKKYFNAKIELLNCLISLILGTENLFCPYANVTLYKVLDFLTDNDWLKRKLALNVIYTLIFYCKEEIMPLKDHIINFLRVLKTDKVKEVREVCLLILQIFSENEPKKENQPENYSAFSSQKYNKEIKKPNNEFYSKKNKTEKQRPRYDLKNKINNFDNENENENDNLNNKNYNNNYYDNEVNSFENSEKIVKNNENKKKFENNKKYEFIEDKVKEKEKEEEENNRSRTPIIKRKSTGEESNNNNINHNKLVNRKDDNTFVNEKMKIRPDPNKSIFRASPNSAFFNQAKNKNNDIIVMAKGDPTKFNYNENDNEDKIIENPPSPFSPNNNNNKIKNLNNTQPIIQNKKISKTIDNENNNNSNKVKKINKTVLKEKNNYENDFKNKLQNDNNNNNNNNNNDNKYQNEIRTRYYKVKDRGEKKINNKNGNNYNKNNKNINNNTFGLVDKNKKVDSILINKLLSQMNNLSAKQLSLIDVMENIQTDAQQQIQSLNEKIFSLDSLVDELTSELNDLINHND